MKRPLLALMPLLCAACASAPHDPGPLKAQPAVDAGLDEAIEEALEANLPPAIAAASDDTARTLACLEYNHIDLLNATDKRDRPQVQARLGELKAASVTCRALVARHFKEFGPLVLAFDREWRFYEGYFRLTLASFAVNNRQSFCRRYALAVEASRDALEAVRHYASWLDSAETARSADLLAAMRRRAHEKYAGLNVVVARLSPQYQKECKP